MTRNFIVGVREVHMRHYKVTAKDEGEARNLVGIRGPEVTDMEYLEYSHELNSDTWSVEEETEEGVNREFQVTWTIDIDAESFEDAVRIALEIQRYPNSIATHFQVKDATGAIRELDTGCLRKAEVELE
jgi:hypothetical protein